MLYYQCRFYCCIIGIFDHLFHRQGPNDNLCSLPEAGLLRINGDAAHQEAAQSNPNGLATQ